MNITASNQTHARLHSRFLVLMIAVMFTLFAPNATAQDNSPNAILEASRQAIAEVPGFNAQFKMGGVGGSMFADTMPSMNGMLFFGVSEEFGRVIHAVGEAKDKKSDPSTPLDMLVSNDRYIWTDRSKQTINEIPKNTSIRGNPSSLTLLLIDSIIRDDPFAKDANNAQSITLGAQEKINGVLCDQIVIKRAKRPSQPRGNTSDAYTDVIWWIGVDDKLPRKVDQITDAGLVKITLSFELSKLKLAAPKPEQLDVARPDGFAFSSRMPKDEPKTGVSDDRQINPNQISTTDPRPVISPTNDAPVEQSNDPMAPPFAFTPVDASEVNNATQAGRWTLLYFGGSWCVPCSEASPMIQQLASDYAPDVDVFSLSIRERDPNQVRRSHPSGSDQLVINPEGITSSFKVRVFPTLVLIDPVGRITFQKNISRQLDVLGLIEQARSAIDDGLARATHTTD